MADRGLASCNQCNAKFLSEHDVENHIASSHGEAVVVATTRFGRDTQDRMDEDIEAIFANDGSDNSSDGSDDEPDGPSEYQDFLENLQNLREACLPLAQKMRPISQTGTKSSKKMKRWPELKDDAKQFSGNFGSKNTSMSSWRGRTKEAKGWLDGFALWGNLLRGVEGKFGSGVFEYFKFLKWSMGLNLSMALLGIAFIVLPQLLLNGREEELHSCGLKSTPPLEDTRNNSLWYPKDNVTECCSEQYSIQQKQKRDLGWPPGNATDFFDIVSTVLVSMVMGDGWMEDTMLYYGGYREDNLGSYQTAIAYFFVIFSCFSLSLLQIVRSSAHAFKRNFKWNQFNSSQYFDLVFCSWDFSIDTKESVNIKQLGLVNEIKTALITDTLQAQKSSMTSMQRFLLRLKRFLAWFFILAVYTGDGFLIVFVYGESNKILTETANGCPGFDAVVSGDHKVDAALCNIAPFILSLTITSVNLIVPFLFSFIIQYEEYDPKTKLVIDITRSIFLRVISLLVAIFTIISNNDCDYLTTKADDDGMYLQTCSNLGSNFNTTTNLGLPEACQKKMCWETSVGSEFYTLTLLDMLIQVGLLVLVDTPRAKLPCLPDAVSKIEFNIPKHFLDIIYSQTICWMGLFFSPLLSLITFIKLFVIFYIRIGYLKFLCVPSASLYEASKMSSILKNFLLISFACALGPLAYIIAMMEPSNACGPFIRLDKPTFYSGIVEDLIETWEAVPGQNFFYFLGRLEILMLVSAGFLLFTYLMYTVGRLLLYFSCFFSYFSRHRSLIVFYLSAFPLFLSKPLLWL